MIYRDVNKQKKDIEDVRCKNKETQTLKSPFSKEESNNISTIIHASNT